MDTGISAKAVRGNPDATKPYRFRPGQSGNPSGRPKYALLSRAYRNQLETICETDPEHRTYAEVIAEALAKQAVKGNIQAAAEIADRVEGRPRQAITVGREEAEGPNVYELISRIAGRSTPSLESGSESGDRTPVGGGDIGG
jgi:hypothetical protein